MEMKNDQIKMLLEASDTITDFARSIAFTLEKRTEVHGDLAQLSVENLQLIKRALEIISERAIRIRFNLTSASAEEPNHAD